MHTRMTAVFVILAAAGLVLAAQLGAFQGQEPRAIPLNTAYATFNQDGLKALDNAVSNDDLRQMLDQIQAGPQRIVLCEGKDVAAAVKSAGMSFTMSDMSSSMPDQPIPVVTIGTDERVWLAAFLGADGSIPPAYKVRAIEVSGRTIRLSYERDDSSGRTCDLIGYLVWASIGRMDAGVYTIELFDSAAGNVTVTRQWQVAEK
jgi:hypothetical protein